MIGRRNFITGLVSLVAAPAIVRAGSLMPVKTVSLRSVITPSEMGIDLFDFEVMMADLVRVYAVPQHMLRDR